MRRDMSSIAYGILATEIANVTIEYYPGTIDVHT